MHFHSHADLVSLGWHLLLLPYRASSARNLACLVGIEPDNSLHCSSPVLYEYSELRCELCLALLDSLPTPYSILCPAALWRSVLLQKLLHRASPQAV
ncbi:hypothetical protein V8E51_000637 [Hyaloscypha variabilis]